MRRLAIAFLAVLIPVSLFAQLDTLPSFSSAEKGPAASVSFGDFDGDGDLDLASGRSDGSFAVHYFPEPGRGLLLGAGMALLWGLGRVRRRERTRRGER